MTSVLTLDQALLWASASNTSQSGPLLLTRSEVLAKRTRLGAPLEDLGSHCRAEQGGTKAWVQRIAETRAVSTLSAKGRGDLSRGRGSLRPARENGLDSWHILKAEQM